MQAEPCKLSRVDYTDKRNVIDRGDGAVQSTIDGDWVFRTIELRVVNIGSTRKFDQVNGPEDASELKPREVCHDTHLNLDNELSFPCPLPSRAKTRRMPSLTK